MHISHFVYSFIVVHLDCFNLLIIANNKNLSVQIFLLDLALNSFVYTLRNGIVGSYGKSIFKFLRNCHVIFPVVASFHIPTNSALGFQFFHTLAIICTLDCDLA